MHIFPAIKSVITIMGGVAILNSISQQQLNYVNKVMQIGQKIGEVGKKTNFALTNSNLTE